MPVARVQMPDGRIARFDVAEGTPPAVIENAVRALAERDGLGPAPTTSRGAAYARAAAEGATFGMAPWLSATMLVADEFGVNPVAQADTLGMFREEAHRSREAFETSRREHPDVFDTVEPIAGAAVGSALFPPGALASRLPLATNMLGRLASRFGPTVLASGVGGGAGAAVNEATDPESSPASIAQAGLLGGAEMAAAEIGGLGLAGAASRLIAPNMRSLDALKPVRDAISQFAREVPEHARAAVSRVVEALPPGTARNAAEAARAAARQVNDVFHGLVQRQTSSQSRLSTQATANRVAAAMNWNGVRNSAAVIDRAARNPEAFRALRARLSSQEFNDFLTVALSRVLERATVKHRGRRVLDPARLKAEFGALAADVQGAYPLATRKAIDGASALGSTLQRVERFTRSPVVRAVADQAAFPIVNATFGLSVGLPLMIAKALMQPPGPLVRYLTRTPGGPNNLVRMIGRQGETTAVRGLLSEGDEE